MKYFTKDLLYIIFFIIFYLILSLLILPDLLKHYEYNPSLETAPKTTFTKAGKPGDPINVGLVGTYDDLIRALTVSGWSIADTANIRNITHEIESIIIKKPYKSAPVSSLYYLGRKHDIAFEQIFDNTPLKRHHVRFWYSEEYAKNGLPLWLGAITFDRGIGINHYTGEITHHIDPDIDKERDKLMNDLKINGQINELYQVTGIGTKLFGRNGEGDKYFTDGEMSIGVINKSTFTVSISNFHQKENPLIIKYKIKFLDFIKKYLK